MALLRGDDGWGSEIDEALQSAFSLNSLAFPYRGGGIHGCVAAVLVVRSLAQMLPRIEEALRRLPPNLPTVIYTEPLPDNVLHLGRLRTDGVLLSGGDGGNPVETIRRLAAPSPVGRLLDSVKSEDWQLQWVLRSALRRALGRLVEARWLPQDGVGLRTLNSVAALAVEMECSPDHLEAMAEEAGFELAPFLDATLLMHGLHLRLGGRSWGAVAQICGYEPPAWTSFVRRRTGFSPSTLEGEGGEALLGQLLRDSGVCPPLGTSTRDAAPKAARSGMGPRDGGVRRRLRRHGLALVANG